MRASRSALAISYGFLVPVVVFSLVPFIWVFVAAFDATPQLWFTRVEFTLLNFVEFFTDQEGFRWLMNSVIYAVGTLVLVIVASALGGYTLSRMQVWWKTPFLYFIVLIRILPVTTFIVPLFKLIRDLGLLDSYWSVIIVEAAFNLPLALWIMKTFYDTIPVELEEAVWIDGGSRLTSLIYVVLPLSLPGVAATAVFTFIHGWGTFLPPLLFISSPEKLPLGVGIFKAFTTVTAIDFGFMTALAVVYMIPTIILFVWARTYLIRSFNIGGVGG